MKEKLHRECFAISSRDMVLDRAYVLGEDISRQKKAVPSYSQEMPVNTISAFLSLIQKKKTKDDKDKQKC